jgi:histone H4
MSQRGKGAKGSLAKRHQKPQRDALEAVFTKPAVQRLSRRGGIKRVSGTAHVTTRLLMKVFLQTVLRSAVAYTEHSRRKTVNVRDLKHAFKQLDLPALYGYEKKEKERKKKAKKAKESK